MQLGRFIAASEFLRIGMSPEQASAAEEKSAVWSIAYNLWLNSKVGVSKKSAHRLGTTTQALKALKAGGFEEISREDLIRLTAKMLFRNIQR